jgi:translation initiation factor 1
MTAGEKKPPPGAASQGPFAALAGLREGLPAGPAGPAVAPEAAKPAAKEPRGPARAVVRLERKGRGGKEATIVEKLGLAATELERWCKEAKAAMGCGGTVDGDTIVLQGDLRRRMEPWLLARGVRKVTVA